MKEWIEVENEAITNELIGLNTMCPSRIELNLFLLLFLTF